MANEVNRIAELLLDAWKKADPKSSVALHPTSYVATFADMATAIIEDRNTRPAAQVAGLELDKEATAENIARHISKSEKSGRLHEPTYNAAKAGALMALECLPSEKVAPVEGLETVAYRYRHVDYVNWTYCESKYPRLDIRNEELVTRSQAEAIIAAKDASINEICDENDRLTAALKETWHKHGGTEIALGQWKFAAEKAEADNAALTARVKELETERDHWKEYSSGQRKLMECGVFVTNDEYVRLAALETQLAAARREIKRLVLKEGGVEEECP